MNLIKEIFYLKTYQIHPEPETDEPNYWWNWFHFKRKRWVRCALAHFYFGSGIFAFAFVYKNTPFLYKFLALQCLLFVGLRLFSWVEHAIIDRWHRKRGTYETGENGCFGDASDGPDIDGFTEALGLSNIDKEIEEAEKEDFQIRKIQE